MKNCRDVEPLKAPYVDGEARPDQRETVETHLTACGPCRNEVAVERAARDVLVARRNDLRPSTPAELKARCAALSNAAPLKPLVPAALSESSANPGRRTLSGTVASAFRRKPAWIPLSVAATFVLAVAGVFALGLTHRAQALALQMTVDHVSCSRTLRPSETAAAAAIERWPERFGWPVRAAPSSPAASLQLQGVRRCFLTDGRVAHLLYEWDGDPLSVYVLPAETMTRPAEVRRFGHDTILWSQNGRTYAVLAPAPRRAELDGVLQYVKANVY